MVHPYDDSDSSGDEVDWQDTRHDPYRAGRTSAGEDKITATRQSAKRRPDASVAELLYTLSQLHHHPFLCVCVCRLRQTSDHTEERLHGEGEEHHHQT